MKIQRATGFEILPKKKIKEFVYFLKDNKGKILRDSDSRPIETVGSYEYWHWLWWIWF